MTMEFSPRLFPHGGGSLEKKICLYQGIRRRDHVILTKANLAFWGGPLENKICLDKGIPRRDHGILTKANLACGGDP